jgi:hypothetical protein
MEGALAGHGAVWPLPTVTNAALHAALHDAQRSGHLAPNSAHRHDHMRGTTRALKDVRAFGSLTTAGPFPVHAQMGEAETWFFPCPLDLTGTTLTPTLVPLTQSGSSSLPAPLAQSLQSRQPPAKDSPAKAWLSADAFHSYLSGSTETPTAAQAVDDEDIYLAETSIGIAIDAATGKNEVFLWGAGK